MGKTDEIWKKIKIVMQDAGCDVSKIKELQKSMEKTKKQLPAVTARYELAHKNVLNVQQQAMQLEQMLLDTDGWDKEQRKQMVMIGKELKRMQNTFDHPFIVSSEDKEFHLTYDTLISMLTGADAGNIDPLILQSETENLLDLLKEALNKKQPSFLELSWFYQNRPDKDFTGMTEEERNRLLHVNMEKKFLHPMRQNLIKAIQYAVQRSRQLEGENDKRSQKEKEVLGLLVPAVKDEKGIRQHAEKIIRQLTASETNE